MRAGASNDANGIYQKLVTKVDLSRALVLDRLGAKAGSCVNDSPAAWAETRRPGLGERSR
jgi:hypothetical protein